MGASPDKKTALHARHAELGAKIVPFGGFLMPLSYAGQLAEHEAVRTGVGLFDLSHMGEFRLTGPDAVTAADRLVTNRFTGTEPGQAVYSPMCREDGTIIDDLILYHLEDSVFIVPNASNIEKDAAWITERLPDGITFSNESDRTSLIAIQGPRTREVLQPLASVALDPMDTYTAQPATVGGVPVLLSRTGYTGEDGFELYVDNAQAVSLWNLLMEAGAGAGIQPIGLAARDTLRFEMGYCLYGNDIDDTTTPLEAGLRWAVKLKGDDFIGRDALIAQQAAGVPRRLVGLEPEAPKRIPRSGYPVLAGETPVGRVTSGTYAPSLARGLAMGYVDPDHAAPGSTVAIDVRGRHEPAQVRRLPFYTKGSRKAPPRKTT